MPRQRQVKPYGQTVKRRTAGYGKANRSFIDVYQRPAPFLMARDRGVGTPGERIARQARESKAKGEFYIQGQKASDLEWRVYRALLLMDWTDEQIVFQTPILGGRMPGGQVLDFVLYGYGAVYVIQVNGDYWHRYGRQGEQTKANEAAVQKVMPSAVVIPLFSSDLLTDDMALNKLRRLVGRGGG